MQRTFLLQYRQTELVVFFVAYPRIRAKTPARNAAYNRFTGENLTSALDNLRSAICSYSGVASTPMRRSLYALTCVEQAAVNAPDNRGWLRKRLIDLRESLEKLQPSPFYQGRDMLALYREIALGLL